MEKVNTNISIFFKDIDDLGNELCNSKELYMK